MSIQEDERRYMNALHAIQSGVALEMIQGSRDTEPKHLRVGVNSAMIQISALVKILTNLGLFTMEEWYEFLADATEEEKERYEKRLGFKLQ